MKLIFAQGNPDPQYKKTRHNTGFMVLDAFGDLQQAVWKESDKFTARIAELSLGGEKVLLVQPHTYYNDTGTAARKLIDFYKLDPSKDLLVIHDDIALPLGTLRIRQKGSDAGNNGVKSLNTHLGPDYARLRIGTWTESRDQMNDVDFVLGKFSKDEEKRVEKHIIPRAVEIINDFIRDMLSPSSTQA